MDSSANQASRSARRVAARLARLENLDAHAAAVELRLAALRERAAAGGVTP